MHSSCGWGCGPATCYACLLQIVLLHTSGLAAWNSPSRWCKGSSPPVPYLLAAGGHAAEQSRLGPAHGPTQGLCRLRPSFFYCFLQVDILLNNAGLALGTAPVQDNKEEHIISMVSWTGSCYRAVHHLVTDLLMRMCPPAGRPRLLQQKGCRPGCQLPAVTYLLGSQSLHRSRIWLPTPNDQPGWQIG